MYGWIQTLRVSSYRYVWMYGCMDVWMYGCMDVRIRCVSPHIDMDVWMDVCVPPHISIGTAHKGVRKGVILLHTDGIVLSYS